ncbi:MAG: DeoR/GlpR family DNA-binding transcription regulator [Lachnospiraceae bacterium]|nr:DeoR/GlpR family DNA-binding transcription regulator [Lachnospiraceae bacterium]
MSVSGRLTKIRNQLLQEGRVSVSALSKAYEVSPETIRRDLAVLCREGPAERIYGGARLKNGEILKSGEKNNSFALRRNLHREEKQKIAFLAATLVSSGASISCDGSTTALELIRSLENREDITVLTNAASALPELVHGRFRTIQTGGMLKNGSGYLTGEDALENVQNYYCDFFFASCRCIDRDGCIYDDLESETSVKAGLRERSSVKVLLADHTKLMMTGERRWGRLEDFDVLVTDRDPGEVYVRMCEESKVRLLY